jgi:hypothetical protein
MSSQIGGMTGPLGLLAKLKAMETPDRFTDAESEFMLQVVANPTWTIDDWKYPCDPTRWQQCWRANVRPTSAATSLCNA